MSSLKLNTRKLARQKSTIGRRRKSYSDQDRLFFSFEDPFWIDQNFKIALSKAYRRMEGKTQVFYSPKTPHARTRMTHTAEVKSLASLITRNLGLNHHLAEAIALGHDIGHVPFGHLGERFLSKKLGKPFRHNAFAVIIAEKLERDGKGLNLCYETLEGIYRHSGKLTKFDYSYPQEYFAVRIADKASYVFSDYNDAKRMGYVKESNKENPIEKLGDNQRERINNVFHAIFEESMKKGKLSFKDSRTAKLFKNAYDWMFEKVYAEADKEIDIMLLERGFEYVRDFDFDPIIAFGLLTEKEIKYFARLNHINREEVEATGITEILEGVGDIEVNDFSSFCFKKEDFERY